MLSIENEKIIRPIEGTEDFLGSHQNMHANTDVKQQATRENKRNPAKVTSPHTQDTAASPEEKMLGSRMKGKVKDFIKMFNPEGSPKRKGKFETPARRPRGKDGGKGKADDPVLVPTAKADEQLKTTSRDGENVFPVSYHSILNFMLQIMCIIDRDQHHCHINGGELNSCSFSEQ